MSETLLEAAQNPTEAVTVTEPVTPAAAVAATPGTETHASSEQPAAAAATTEQPAAAATATDGAPEKYEFTPPEGKTFDPKALASFEEAARAANLPQDKAQKMLETVIPALAARQVEQMTKVHEEWRTATTSDKELGGEKLKENLGIAKRALNAFDPLPASTDGKPATTPLRTLLEETGLGNHPEVLRLLFRAGKAISEDTVVTRGRGGSEGGPVNPLDVLYPTNKKD